MSVRLETIHIAGGGIAGLTLGVALHKKGFDVQIYEAAESYARVGGGHWLYANALQVLAAIDESIVRDMQALGQRFEGFLFLTNRERRLLFERTQPFTERVGVAPIVMHRADIIGQLAARVPAERIHFGKRAARVEGRRLHFEDGSSVEAGVLIGADGIHSVVRGALGPYAPRDSGQTGMWGVTSCELASDKGRYFTEMWGDGRRTGLTRVGTGEVYWFMVVKGEAVPEDRAALKAFILERAQEFPADVQRVVEQTDAEAIHDTPLFDVSPLPRWHDARIYVLGDAAHACTPNLGQGGCQAIEDGYWLAEMLDRHETAELAFRAFQKKRRFRASVVTYLSRWLGELAQTGGWFLGRARYVVTWLLPAILLRPALAWIMTLPRDWANR